MTTNKSDVLLFCLIYACDLQIYVMIIVRIVSQFKTCDVNTVMQVLQHIGPTKYCMPALSAQPAKKQSDMINIYFLLI